MDIQPKIDAGLEEKSKSNIVYEAAQMIMDRIALEIDPDQCNPNHYKVKPVTIFSSLQLYMQEFL